MSPEMVTGADGKIHINLGVTVEELLDMEMELRKIGMKPTHVGIPAFEILGLKARIVDTTKAMIFSKAEAKDAASV